MALPKTLNGIEAETGALLKFSVSGAINAEWFVIKKNGN